MDQYPQQNSPTPAPTPQASTPAPAPQLPAKTGWTWREILTLIFLILSPLIGVILMWTLARWSKKTKIIITLIAAALIALPLATFLIASIVSSI